MGQVRGITQNPEPARPDGIKENGVTDGIRTRDNQNHNLALYR
jgi:hypothetical protein